MPLVTDASVCIKWFVPEEGSRQADSLLNRNAAPDPPDLVLAEVGNALWRQVERGILGESKAQQALAFLLRGAVVLHPTDRLLPRAFSIAIELRHPIYDCFYLALAEALDAPLITADRRLAAAVPGTRWEATVELIGGA